MNCARADKARVFFIKFSLKHNRSPPPLIQGKACVDANTTFCPIRAVDYTCMFPWDKKIVVFKKVASQEDRNPFLFYHKEMMSWLFSLQAGHKMIILRKNYGLPSTCDKTTSQSKPKPTLSKVLPLNSIIFFFI